MVKASTVIGIAIVAVVGFLAYQLLSKGSGSVSPSLSTPQSGQIGNYPSANSSASGGGLSVSEVYNYSPSTISESTHTYQTTNTANVKAGLFNF